MNKLCRLIVASKTFKFGIVALIVGSAALTGIETYPTIKARYGDIIHILDWLIVALFTVEVAIKMAALWPKPLLYFRDRWNVFDFIIVAICYLPFAGAAAAVLRLVRIVRAFRLISVLPRLQLLVGAMFKSMPSMAYVGILLAIHFYIYAALGSMLFGKNDPLRFGTLDRAMLTMFNVVTLEGFPEIMYTQIYGSDKFGYHDKVALAQAAPVAESDTGELFDPTAKLPYQPSSHPIVAPVFFVSFILLGTMIMLNLFIGVILKSMDEVQAEHDERERHKHEAKGGRITIEDDLNLLEAETEKLRHHLRMLRSRIGTEERERERAKIGLPPEDDD